MECLNRLHLTGGKRMKRVHITYLVELKTNESRNMALSLGLTQESMTYKTRSGLGLLMRKQPATSLLW